MGIFYVIKENEHARVDFLSSHAGVTTEFL